MSWIKNTSQSSTVYEKATNYSITYETLARELRRAEMSNASIDTVSSQKLEKREANQISDKVQLPKANPNTDTGDGDYLSTLAEAFGKIYSSMSQTVQDQLKSQQQIIQVDQTISQCVMDSTNNSINSLKASNQKISDLETEQKKEQKDDALWSKVAFVIGVLMVIGSIALAVATGGASAAAEAPLVEMEMSDMLAPELSEIPESSSDIPLTQFDSESPTNTLDSESDEDIFQKSGNNWYETNDFSENLNDYYDSPEDEDTQAQAKQQSEEQLQESNKTASKAKAALTKLSKFLVGGGLGTISAMPNIYQAKANFAIASYQHELAGLIAAMGPAQAATQENNMYYQFYQQLVQRGAQIVQQLAEQTSSVVEIDGSIMGAYQQIAITLAQSA